MKEPEAELTGAAGCGPANRSSGNRPVDVLLAQRERLRQIAAGMGLAGADIDDCLQDVSVKALENTDRFDSEGSCLCWLARVTINRSLTEHRRRKRFTKKASQILKRAPRPTFPSAASRAAMTEEIENIRLGLRELDGTVLAPLVLTYFCGLDSAETGRVLDLKASTVRSRLREARLKLAGQLAKKGIER